MREAWNIHDFQASKVVPSPHAVFCGVWLCIVTKMQIRCFE